MTNLTLKEIFEDEKKSGSMYLKHDISEIYDAAKREDRLLPLTAFTQTYPTYLVLDDDKQNAFVITHKQNLDKFVGRYQSVNSVVDMLHQYIACNTEDLTAAAMQEYTKDALNHAHDELHNDVDEERIRLLEQKRSQSHSVTDQQVLQCLRDRVRIEETIRVLQEHAGVTHIQDPVADVLKNDAKDAIKELIKNADTVCQMFGNQVDMFDFAIKTLNDSELDSRATLLPENAVRAKDDTKDLAKLTGLKNTTFFYNRN